MPSFNVRVYGVLINAQRQVLLSREYIRGLHLLKFPGGGLEFGEGTRDCLVREFEEETGLAVRIGKHLYTTDFFQRSFEDRNDQLISIYYEVLLDGTTTEGSDFDEDTFIEQCRLQPEAVIEQRRWVLFDEVTPELLTLPIDKHVARHLRDWF